MRLISPGVLFAPLTPDHTTIPRVAFTKSLVLSYSSPTGDGQQTLKEQPPGGFEGGSCPRTVVLAVLEGCFSIWLFCLRFCFCLAEQTALSHVSRFSFLQGAALIINFVFLYVRYFNSESSHVLLTVWNHVLGYLLYLNN